MSPEIEINIFDYIEYRAFIRDRFNYLKEHKKLTLRDFARRAGLGSHAFLKQIIDGDRSLTVATTYKVGKGLSLNEKETDFLELLVRFTHSTSIDEKNSVFKKILKRRPPGQRHKIERESYHLFSNWYIMAIRELVACRDFREDPVWIAQRLDPKIDPRQAREAIDLLLSTGFLKRDARGKLTQAEGTLTTGAEVEGLYIVNYHRSLLELASRSMVTGHEKLRDISALTFALDREEFRFIKSRVAEFRSEILEYLKENRKYRDEEVLETNENIYNLTIQFFHATRPDWKTK